MDTKDDLPIILKDCESSTLEMHSEAEHLVFEGAFATKLLDILVQFKNLKSLLITHTGNFRLWDLVFLRLVPTLENLQSLVMNETDYCLIHKTSQITDSEIQSIIEPINKPFYLILSGVCSKSFKDENIVHPNMISMKTIFHEIDVIDDKTLRATSDKTTIELKPLFPLKIAQLKRPKVESLRIHIRDAWKRNLSFINSWSNLKRLEIYGNIKEPFFDIPSFSKQAIQQDKDSGIVDLSWLDGNTNIVEFVINANIMTKLILPSLPNTKTIDVRNTGAFPVIMKKLSGCKKLEKLYITRSGMNGFELESLKGLDELEILCLTDNDASNLHSSLDFTQILEIKNLKELLIPLDYTPKTEWGEYYGYPKSKRDQAKVQEDAYEQLIQKGVKVKIASRGVRDPSKFKVMMTHMKDVNLIDSFLDTINNGNTAKIGNLIDSMIAFYESPPTWDQHLELCSAIEKIVSSVDSKHDLLLAKTLSIPSAHADYEPNDRHFTALQAISDLSNKAVLTEIISYITNSKWIPQTWQRDVSEQNTTERAFLFASEKIVGIGEGKSILLPLLKMSEYAFSRIGETSLELAYKIDPDKALEIAVDIQCGEESSWTAENIISGHPTSVFEMAKDDFLSDYARRNLIHDVIRHSKEDANSVVDYLCDNIENIMDYDLEFLLELIESHAGWRLDDFKAAIKTRDEFY